MQPRFDPTQPFSKVYGDSPADIFQAGHHFDGHRKPITWAEAAGEVEVPRTAADTERQSMEAVERAKGQTKAQSPVQTDAPHFDGTVTVGQPSEDQPSLEDAVKIAQEALDASRKEKGVKPIAEVQAVSDKAERDDAGYQAHQKRYEKALKMNAVRLQGVCTQIIEDCQSRGEPVDTSFPKTGAGSQKANAKFVANNTE